MFYFPLISVQNGDKCLSREKKEIVFYPDKKVYVMPIYKERYDQDRKQR